MFDINEIMNHAQQASEQAADSIKETFEKWRSLARCLGLTVWLK